VAWNRIQITNDYGKQVEALAPLIISASRSTDIPAFYSDWFFHRLKTGHSLHLNPFNGKKIYISYTNVHLIVFWSKNPQPLLSSLDYLKERAINYYIHFTLNNYENEQFEKGVPPLISRIDTFKRLVDKSGFGKVIWRFDPLILTDCVFVEDLLRKIEHIGDQLYGYTEKLVFSFADIQDYSRVKHNLLKNNIHYRDFTPEDIRLFASELCKLNHTWNYTLTTCSEKMDFSHYNIHPNKCIDDDLIIKYFSDDKQLMDFLGIKIIGDALFSEEKNILKTKHNKDRGQRANCNCIISKDIGKYTTCPHGCVYCYANASAETAKANFYKHAKNRFSEII
jgi:DNA repair photolyase